MYKKDPLGNDIPSTEVASSQRGSIITPEMANVTSRCPLVPLQGSVGRRYQQPREDQPSPSHPACSGHTSLPLPRTAQSLHGKWRAQSPQQRQAPPAGCLTASWDRQDVKQHLGNTRAWVKNHRRLPQLSWGPASGNLSPLSQFWLRQPRNG